MRQYTTGHSHALHLPSVMLLAGCALWILLNAPVISVNTLMLPISPLTFTVLAAAGAIAVWATSETRPTLQEFTALVSLGALWVAIAVLNGVLDLSQVGFTARVTVHNHILFMAVLISFTLALASLDAHRIVGGTIVVAVLVNAAFILFESTTRLSLSPDSLAMVESPSRFRSAGLFMQPNVSAKFLVLGLACSVFATPKRWALPYFLFVALAVFFTGSRSNMLLTALLFVLASRHLLGSRSVIALIYAGTLAAVAYAAIATNVTSGLERIVGDDVADNIAQIVDRVQGGFDDVDDSRDSRIEASKQAWETLLAQPLGGSGVQQFETLENQLDLTPHNTYATQGVLFGFPGLLWLGTLTSLIVFRTGWRSLLFVTCFLASCLFSGENLQDLFIAVFLALTFAMPRQRRWHHAMPRQHAVRRQPSASVRQPRQATIDHTDEPDNPNVKVRRRRRRRRTAIDALGNEDLESLDL